MTPLPTVPGVAKVSLGFTIGEDTTTGSSFYVKYTGSPSPAGLNAFAAAVQAAYSARLKAYVTSDRILTSVTVVDLNNPTASAGVWAGSPVPGTNIGNVVASACLVVSFRIARRYRGGHPRAYMPIGGSTDVLNSQKWAVGAMATWLTAWNNFMADVIAFPGPPALSGQCSVSYYSGGTWVQHMPSGRYVYHPTLRPVPLVDNIVNTKLNQRIGSQRRRLEG